MRQLEFTWVALLAAALCLSGCDASDRFASPAFNARQLAEAPRKGWITNGGNILNHRYSPLDTIDRENVAKLKGVWRASLGGSGMGPGFSAEAQPLIHEGVIYVVTGENDAFAIDVETGNTLWKYDAGIDLKKTVNVCCGWLSRGLGMGEGKIFVGQLDAKLVALDQRTGEIIWSVQAADPSVGYSITSAPLYYEGLVIVGFAGGEYGIRGRISAYDAKTGEEIWNFWTIPRPGEFGHDTWPQDNDAWKYGGAPVWQTPAVDPELGLIYFSTGNPGPDLNGAIRAGDNLFSVAVVALDVKTGKYRWHFQEVHHDIWDYDSPNPVILFDAAVDGKPRKGIANASKSGYLYILDRVTGEPLIGIPETPVPQEPTQATAATQPIPVGDDLVAHRILKAPEGWELVNEGKTFAPFKSDKATLYAPSAGVNWPPSSYDPKSNLMFICTNSGIGGAFGGDADGMIGPPPGQQYMQGGFSGARGAGGVVEPQGPSFAAVNLTTNRIAWRQMGRVCAGGSITTAGGLIFVGRADGVMTALDSSDGKLLWEFQTDGGIHGTPTTFEYKGKQYVVVIAGGHIFSTLKSNDGVWLFALDGAMQPLPADVTKAIGPRGVAVFAPPPAVPSTRKADVKHGEEIYRTVCMACHGENGEGGHENGPPLPKTLTIDSIMYTADAGRNDMPSFRGTYNAGDFHDVASYIHDVLLAR
ncbi:MAG: PQQ-binding-like beta-propeller repeat protein [Hyphomonadaceae bacterium]|nr:PQQ-binding-like beta-propeller repeat protein [Hyphomonadaceae bacterium]